MPYHVVIVPSALRTIKRLPADWRTRIANRIDDLSQNPRPPDVKKLTGAANLWRVREGDYRIIYEIRDEVVLVTVTRVAWRDKAYR